MTDFVSAIKPCDVAHINGVGNSKHAICGIGLVEWTIIDANDEVFVIQTLAYYVPSADIRLFSPQTYIQEQPPADEITSADIRRQGIYLNLRQCPGKRFFFPYNPRNNIPYMLPEASEDSTQDSPEDSANQSELPTGSDALTVDDYEVSMDRKNLAFINQDDVTLLGNAAFMQALLNVTDEANKNISPAQKELLLHHYRCCHAGMDWVQKLMIAPKEDLGVKRGDPII